MDLTSTLVAIGWASGVNAYASVALLGLLGRAGVGEVPAALESDPVIALAAVMFVVEFITDKIPLLDSAWDVLHTAVRPAVASAVGASFGAEADLSGLDEALAAGGTGGTALLSHGVKAGIRLGVNSSPEPFSNILVSLVEDGLVAAVIALALADPLIAGLLALLLLIVGISIVIVLSKLARGGLARLRAWRERARAP
ncbi:DUF4126 domain-containing protein [Thermoleophilia bacterium SCSIO 60948]|nr:DUF4126 domain-containing protein [Thermoleophilia bacterium SCSIO 60948]